MSTTENFMERNDMSGLYWMGILIKYTERGKQVPWMVYIKRDVQCTTIYYTEHSAKRKLVIVPCSGFDHDDR